jgi:Putative peptidoglycan binding domain
VDAHVTSRVAVKQRYSHRVRPIPNGGEAAGPVGHALVSHEAPALRPADIPLLRRPAGSSLAPSPQDLLHLQRLAGNHAVGSLLAASAPGAAAEVRRTVTPSPSEPASRTASAPRLASPPRPRVHRAPAPTAPLGLLTREPYASSVRLQAAASGGRSVKEGDPDAAAVRAIQQGLAADGFGLAISNRGLEFDGIFGTETTARVKLFQRKHGLNDDGAVGPATLRVLDDLAATVPPGGGDPALLVTGKRASEIERSQVFFERGSSVVDAFERAKIATRLQRERDSAPTPPPDGVINRLSGFASIDESDPLAAERVKAVEKVIGEIDPGRTAKLNASSHRVERERADLRQARRVDMELLIELPEDPEPVPPPSGPVCDDAALAKARNSTVELVQQTADAVGGLPDDRKARRASAAGALYETLFGSFRPADVQTHLLEIKRQLGRYTSARIRCVDPRGDLCGSGTFAVNVGIGDSARMDVCPQAVGKDPGALDTIGTILHEAVHGTPEIRGIDHGYHFERMFPLLTPGEAEHNPDHYRVLAVNLRKGGTLSIGPERPDTSVGFDDPATAPAALAKIGRALAFLQRDLRDGTDTVTQLYPFLAANNDSGTGTVPAAARAARRRLGLPPQPQPIDPEGLAAVAGAADRYRDATSVVNQPVDVRHVEGQENWSQAFGNVLPGVDVNDALVALPLEQLVNTLATRLFQATPGIAPARVPGMTLLLGDLRTIRGHAAPKD